MMDLQPELNGNGNIDQFGCERQNLAGSFWFIVAYVRGIVGGNWFRKNEDHNFTNYVNIFSIADFGTYRGSYRGGRGGFRGGDRDGERERPVFRGGRGGRGGRQFERISGSDRTGIKAMDRKDGFGKGNWGTDQDEMNGQNEQVNDGTEGIIWLVYDTVFSSHIQEM